MQIMRFWVNNPFLARNQKFPVLPSADIHRSTSFLGFIAVWKIYVKTIESQNV